MIYTLLLAITAISAVHVTRMLMIASKSLSLLETKPKKRVSFGCERVKCFDECDAPKLITIMEEIVGCIEQVESPTRSIGVIDWFNRILSYVDVLPEVNMIRVLHRIRDVAVPLAPGDVEEDSEFYTMMDIPMDSNTFHESLHF